MHVLFSVFSNRVVIVSERV